MFLSASLKVSCFQMRLWMDFCMWAVTLCMNPYASIVFLIPLHFFVITVKQPKDTTTKIMWYSRSDCVCCVSSYSSLNKLKPFRITGVYGKWPDGVFFFFFSWPRLLPSRPLLLFVVNTDCYVCLHFCEQVQFYFLQNGWFISVSF